MRCKSQFPQYAAGFDPKAGAVYGLRMECTAIVTGAARGIGRGVADHLERAGWRVARLDADAGPGIIPCDVSDEGSVTQAFDMLGDFFRDGLGLLVNNAGIADPHAGPVEDMPLEVWNRYLAVNLTGAFLMTRAAIPHLRRGGGSIVSIASTRAFMSEPDSEAYAATKAGLVGLSHALAISLGPEVRANAIAPGWIVTSDETLSVEDHAQHPVGRVGRVEDVAGAVEWLAGAGFVTGEVVVIDGGMTRQMVYV
jgi:NAD(P)-dependent dehydrogenase (short-subunit alcohol dehydrogenase family)